MVHCSSEITTRVWAVWVCCCGADGEGVGVVAWWLLLVNAGGALTMERWFGCCFCGDLGDVSATEPLLDGSVWLECFVSCFFVSAVVSSSKLHFGGPVAFLLPSLSSLSHHSFSLQFSVTSSIHLDICLIVGLCFVNYGICLCILFLFLVSVLQFPWRSSVPAPTGKMIAYAAAKPAKVLLMWRKVCAPVVCLIVVSVHFSQSLNLTQHCFLSLHTTDANSMCIVLRLQLTKSNQIEQAFFENVSMLEIVMRTIGYLV